MGTIISGLPAPTASVEKNPRCIVNRAGAANRKASRQNTHENKMHDLTRLQAARERIRAHVTRTPLFRSSTLSDEMGCNVFIKAELFQKVGSFKARGMLNRLLTMDANELRKGVITFSAGNAAQGLAFAARIVGARAVIAMPEAASPAKIAAFRAGQNPKLRSIKRY